MHKLLSGLALVALVAGAAQAKPEGGKGGGGGHGGGNPHAVSGGGGGGGPGGGGKVRGGGGEGRAHAAVQGGGQGPMMQRPMRQEKVRGPDRGPPKAERHFQRQAERQVHRQAERQDRRVERHQERRVERQIERRENRQAEREVRRDDRQAERAMRRDDRQAERSMRREDRRDERAVLRANQDFENQGRFSGRGRALVDGCPPGLAKKYNGCMPPGLAAKSEANAAGALVAAAGTGLLASTLTPSWFGYNDYGPDYSYYDGYLLRTNGNSVLGYVPLLGGALAPGRPWLSSFAAAPVPSYWTDYYDLGPVERYRYYDDVLYQLDPGYSEIDAIVALMAGDPWAVGQPMPYGYQVYNVPYGYRAQYYDTNDHWYRYSDGYIYDIDPTTRLVRTVVQLLGGTPLPGQPWRASYQAAPIPAYWSDYYDLGPVDRYRYYDHVIYELDPGHDEIEEIVAVTSGDTWDVGGRMPYGYDIYNVPYAYRTRYIDSEDHWYRYSDGYVYDIDPTTRLVLAAVQLLA